MRVAPIHTIRSRSSRAVAVVASLGLLLLSVPCAADNIREVGRSLVQLLLGGVVTVGFMITFIVLAARLGRTLRSSDRSGAGRLIRITRVLAFVWYLLALSPVVMLPPRLISVAVLLGLLGGLPAHIPSIIALARARRLARIA